MIPLREQELIRERFREQMTGTVKIDFFTQRPSPVVVPGREPCQFCEETQRLLEDVARQSDKIDLRVREYGADRALEERYGIERVPATVVRGVLNRPVVFYGIPMPDLFAVLIEAIVDASGPGPELLPALKRRLKRLKRDVRVQVFVLPADPHSILQARDVQALAMGSRHIRAEIVEVAEYQRLAEGLSIRSVPTTIIDGRATLTGYIAPETLADHIVRATEHTVLPARGGLITNITSEASTPLPQGPPSQEHGTVRPSGLFIPGR